MWDSKFHNESNYDSVYLETIQEKSKDGWIVWVGTESNEFHELFKILKEKTEQIYVLMCVCVCVCVCVKEHVYTYTDLS